jgi:hypothetical protein
MSPSEATKQATREEWRELGFYYEMTKEPPRWRFVGSATGLAGFVQLLEEYVGNPRNSMCSEHIHLGPYMYLKVQTAEIPAIDCRGIRGSLVDLARLRDLVSAKLQDGSSEQTFEIGQEYSDNAAFPIQFEIRAKGFDPASADPQLAANS